MFSDSFVIKCKVKFDCYIFVCLNYKGKFCNCYTRDLFAWMFESFILPFLITKLNFGTWYCVLWIVVGSKKLSGNMWLYSCFKMWRESFTRIKLILKFQKHCSFAAWFLIHLFSLLISLLSFLVNLRIALYQQGLIDSYQL